MSPQQAFWVRKNALKYEAAIILDTEYNISYLEFTNDEELEVVSEIKQLKQLRVSHGSLTKRGFTLISKLTNLNMLEISNSPSIQRTRARSPKGRTVSPK